MLLSNKKVEAHFRFLRVCVCFVFFQNWPLSTYSTQCESVYVTTRQCLSKNKQTIRQIVNKPTVYPDHFSHFA